MLSGFIHGFAQSQDFHKNLCQFLGKTRPANECDCSAIPLNNQEQAVHNPDGICWQKVPDDWPRLEDLEHQTRRPFAPACPHMAS